MPPATDPNPQTSAEQVRQQLVGKHVCPFCGVVRADSTQPCPRCTMEDTGATRAATRQRIGPWFVLQARNPSAPGMKFATLLSLVKKGHVTPRSIVRGPTTHQLWTFAARVRGLSRDYGMCWHCGETIDPHAVNCRHCDRPQSPPAEPDALLEHAAAPAQPAPTAADLLGSPSGGPSVIDTGMDGGTNLDLQLDPLGEDAIVDRVAPPAPRRTPPPSSPAGFDAPDPLLAPKPAARKPTPELVPIAPAPAPAVRPRPAATPNLPARPAAKEESILSARELAAAFQLDFKPPGLGKASKPLGFGKIFVFLLFTLIAAAAVVLYLRPDWRDKSKTWALTTWANIRSSLEQPAARRDDPAIKPGPADAVPPATDRTTTRKPPLQTPPQATPPAVTPPAPPAPTPTPRDAIATKAPVTPPPPVVPPAPTPQKAPPPPAPTPSDAGLSSDDAVARAQQLRGQAIDAEGVDWPQALRLYEQIERLPRDAWPADLQVRLNRAREKAR